MAIKLSYVRRTETDDGREGAADRMDERRVDAKQLHGEGDRKAFRADIFSMGAAKDLGNEASWPGPKSWFLQRQRSLRNGGWGGGIRPI